MVVDVIIITECYKNRVNLRIAQNEFYSCFSDLTYNPQNLCSYISDGKKRCQIYSTHIPIQNVVNFIYFATFYYDLET